jgi:hypothetical protein
MRPKEESKFDKRQSVMIWERSPPAIPRCDLAESHVLFVKGFGTPKTGC